MDKTFGTSFLLLLLVVCAGFTLGLTWAPCYASLCSEDFFPYPTRLHIASYYGLLASIGCALLLRAYSPLCLSISQQYLTRRRVPVLDKRISVGGLALSLWILSITLATTGFWAGPEINFWNLRTQPLNWAAAQVRLLVTGIIGHHADILLGLVIIPVSRNSILGQAFELHQSTLLYAHKLLAYLLFVAVAAHGGAYYAFVATYAAAKDNSPRKDAFNIDNPTLTMQQTKKRGYWHSATLATGMVSFLAMLIIVITALPVLRRNAYNTFYYTHVTCSALIFLCASIHASTDFYFLLPGLLLWVFDWSWRFFRGDTGIRKRVEGKLENAGSGWYRISLPVTAKLMDTSKQEIGFDGDGEEGHPIQSYYLNIPSISRLQNHAFTAVAVGSSTTGPVFLFQKAQGSKKKNQKKLEKEWTWKTSDLADNTPDSGRFSDESQTLAVRVEGPYVPGDGDFQTSNHVVCIVGGTGLTGAVSLANWWLNHRSQDCTARFTLLWTIRHRETSQIKEWKELEEQASRNASNVKLQIHVSSESGRVDVANCLRNELNQSEEKIAVGTRSAWVYVSGPDGLLKSAEDACVDIEAELRQARRKRSENQLQVDSMTHYIAQWEV